MPIKYKKLISMISIICIVASLTGCTKKSTPITRTEFYFDTVITITIFDSSKESLLDEAFSICEQYENMFSKTIKDSEVSMLNTRGQSNSAPPDFQDIIKTSIFYSKLTNGAFDITIAPLSSLWNFTDTSPVIPEKEDIANALTRVGYENISIDGEKVFLLDNASIDLGGIAKGYIADKLKEFFLSKDVKSAVINLGGNILEIGNKPNGQPYLVGIQYPFEQSGKTIATVKTFDKSVVTSGCYERYFELNEQIYHHILDPKTGYPVNNELLSVTIISDDSTLGDCLSTACYVLGYEDSVKLLDSLPDVEGIFVDKDFALHLTDGLILKDNVISLK